MSGPFNNQLPGASLVGAQGFGGGSMPFQGTMPVGSSFRIYNVGDDTTANFERFNISWTANILTLLNQAGGTGVVRSLNFGSAVGYQIVNTTVSITLDGTHHTVTVDATAAPVVITLPTAASASKRVYIIKKIDASVNTVTIQANGAETIDGANTQVLATQFLARQVQSDGTQWWQIGHNH